MRNIILPLGLNNTGFEITDSVKANMAIGRLEDGVTEDPLYLVDLKLFAPSGQMYSSTADMIKFFSCMYKENCSILSIENRKLLLLPQYLAPDASFSLGLGIYG